ncbi:hypothetical protein BDZ89DRAFT_1074326 [Hymenopellis radicata]|nr:hypothetical protein BDZ89DRAFT_1074326 [Hymenopellis radicata]
MEVHENFEKLFRRVEEETERRAWEQRHREEVDPFEDEETSQEVKDTRRASVPTSQLTRFSDELSEMINTRNSRRLSTIPPQFCTRRSLDSLASPPWQAEKADKVSTLSRSAPQGAIARQSSTLSRTVGNLLPRRLAGRPRSLSVADVLPQAPPSKMVIGVSVEKATSSDHRDPLPPPTVHAPGLRSRQSKNSLKSSDSLVGKFAKKFRRKSKSVLSTFNC